MPTCILGQAIYCHYLIQINENSQAENCVGKSFYYEVNASPTQENAGYNAPPAALAVAKFLNSQLIGFRLIAQKLDTC